MNRLPALVKDRFFTPDEFDSLLSLWADVPESRPFSLTIMQPDPSDRAAVFAWLGNSTAYAAITIRERLVAFLGERGKWGRIDMPIERLIVLAHAAAEEPA